jgi:hypothetical protein
MGTAGPVWANRPRTPGVVLDLIRAARSISRIELSATSGLTPPTISEAVRELMDQGLVVEAGRGVSTGGKPPTLLQLNASARFSVGVLLESNTCVVVVVDLAGRQVARSCSQGPWRMPPEQALSSVAAQITALLDTAAVDRRTLLGVGLVSYGPQDRRAGRLLTPQPTEEWLDYPVAPRLSEILSMPVLLDNDDRRVLAGSGRPEQHLRLHLHGHRHRGRRRRSR